MWESFKKTHYTGQKPAVSVTPRGIAVNKAAVLLLVADIPDSDLEFTIFIDRKASLIGLRLYVADDGNVDVFTGRRTRTGRRKSGIRQLVNTWKLGVGGAVKQASLEPGRYGVRLRRETTEDAEMIVFGPKPLDSRRMRCT